MNDLEIMNKRMMKKLFYVLLVFAAFQFGTWIGCYYNHYPVVQHVEIILGQPLIIEDPFAKTDPLQVY